MEALIWGTRLVETFADSDLANAARELRVKVTAVSPAERQNASSAMSAFPSRSARAAQSFLGTIRAACGKRQKLAIEYRDLSGMETARVVWPLGLEFWAQVWTMTAWCEFRDDFRVFRCDLLTSCRILEERFRDERGKRLADFLAKLENGKSHLRSD
jgi:predicted DNA-binding transcriptional regulator YafY